jgi:ubiquinone/menaquinone biosynthesis C-methylase UbiE
MITVDFGRINVRPGDRVLDIGCGSGRHTCKAYEIEGARVIGMDRNFVDICEARGRLSYHEAVGCHGGGSWSLAAGDITRLPFSKGSFDLVICSEVLEHVPDDRKAAGELLRVLKPEGDLVVSVPRYVPEKICWKLSTEYFSANGGHVRIYRKPSVRRLFESLGARWQSSHYAHAIHTPYWWLKCWVGPNRRDSLAVNRYHDLLTWDIMERPRITRFLDELLNPLIGKSLVLYFKKT